MKKNHPQLAKYLVQLNNPESIARIEDTYRELYQNLEELEDPTTNMTEWLDEEGDIGVGEYRDVNTEGLRAELGLEDKDKGDWSFPYFVDYRADNGRLAAEVPELEKFGHSKEDEEAAQKVGLTRLSLFWHQYVGVAAILKRVFEKKNVILADGVGVGKTLQCLAVMMELRYSLYRCSTETGNPHQILAGVSVRHMR